MDNLRRVGVFSFRECNHRGRVVLAYFRGHFLLEMRISDTGILEVAESLRVKVYSQLVIDELRDTCRRRGIPQTSFEEMLANLFQSECGGNVVTEVLIHDFNLG